MLVSGAASGGVKISWRKFIVGTSLLGGVALGQILQTSTHRRQIVFPTPFPLTYRKLRISPLYFLFEVHPHSRHDSKIAYHGPADSGSDRLSLLAQGVHRDQ